MSSLNNSGIGAEVIKEDEAYDDSQQVSVSQHEATGEKDNKANVHF